MKTTIIKKHPRFKQVISSTLMQKSCTHRSTQKDIDIREIMIKSCFSSVKLRMHATLSCKSRILRIQTSITRTLVLRESNQATKERWVFIEQQFYRLLRLNEKSTSSLASGPDSGSPMKILPCRANVVSRDRLV